MTTSFGALHTSKIARDSIEIRRFQGLLRPCSHSLLNKRVNNIFSASASSSPSNPSPIIRAVSTFHSLHTHPLSEVHHFSLIRNSTTPISRFGLVEWRKRRTNFHSRHAVEERESEFEVDPDKAREALKKLDQQLQSFSQKQINPPKIRASDLDRAPVQMKEEFPQLTESSLAFLAFALLVFTIFYNVIFITVIKPSIDVPDEPVAATSVRKAPEAVLLPQLLSMPEVSSF